MMDKRVMVFSKKLKKYIPLTAALGSSNAIIVEESESQNLVLSWQNQGWSNSKSGDNWINQGWTNSKSGDRWQNQGWANSKSGDNWVNQGWSNSKSGNSWTNQGWSNSK